MKKLLVIGIIAILVILTLIVLAIKRTENNTVVDNVTNSVVESTIENNTNTTDEVVSDNGDIDTYSDLLLDRDVYDKYGSWTSHQFVIPKNTSRFNLYYQNNGKYKTRVLLYKVSRWGSDKKVCIFSVSPGYRVTYHPSVDSNTDYYVSVESIGGGSIEGNLKVGIEQENHYN